MPAEQLELFRGNLPRKPYCTDDLGQLQIRSVAHAVKRRYIQPNHPNSKLWLLYDIDRATGPEEVTDDLNLPAPTIWVKNRANGHAHALYALETPVHMNPSSSAQAIRFAGALDVAMSAALDADPGYAGLICKNPLHSFWETYTLGNVYDLAELAEYVDLNRFSDRRRNLPDVGLGRNVTLFERLRTWAYRAIRQGWPHYEQWLRACESRAQGYNDFEAPLPLSEVKATAKSVAKWTHKNMSPAGFSAVQASRGRRGGKASSRRKYASNAEKQRAYRERKARR